MDAPTVWLKDEAGRSLFCYLEHTLEIEGQSYGLLQPVDAPVMIFAWPEDESEEPFTIEEEEELQELLPTARAVLSEQNLTLLETAVTLTVEGDLPDIDDEDEAEGNSLNGSSGFDDESEEFQLLAQFFHKDQEYGVYTPLEAFVFVVRLENGEPKLLSPEAFAELEPLLDEAVAREVDL